MISIKPFWVLMLLFCNSSVLLAQGSNSAKSNFPKNNTKQTEKVSSILLKLYTNSIAPEEEEKALQLNLDLLMTQGSMIRIEATAVKDGEVLAKQLKSLAAKDIQVYKRIVNAWVNIKNIPQLEELEELRYAKPVYRPITNIGSANSEGDSALAAKMTRSKFCLDGSGVKIGVLSDTYNANSGATSGVSTGDLPGVGNPNGYTTPVTVVADLTAGSDEGRAMCEIVHDLAPGGELFFATAFTGQAGFASYIEDLYDLHSCDVIVDDVFYYEEPFYMDGVIAQACDYVNSKGVAYFSSAGNNAQSSYEAPFRNRAGSRWHDFDPGPGVDTMQSITVNAGSDIRIVLQWDDPWGSLSPKGAQTDIDLYLYDAAGSSVLLSATDNNLNLDPTEFISGKANGSGTVTFNIAIKNYSGPWPSSLKWVIWGGNGLMYEYAPTIASGLSTCLGHSNAAGAMAVGAAPWFSSPAYGTNPPLPEPFTSSGGTQIRYDLNGNSITPIDRFKPEFTAIDGVSNTFFGNGHFFFGTSAAAPHAAAVGALMIEANENLNPTEVRDIFKNSAIDMSTSGFDYLTGAGLIQADVAMQEVYDNLCNISSISVDSAPTLEIGDTTYSVGIIVKYAGATCNDSLLVNGELFEVTNLDSVAVIFSGLVADGLPLDVTASFSSQTGCSLTVSALFTAPITPSVSIPIDTLVISEIMYDAPETGQDSSEFIEIYNPISKSVDMTGFYFSEGVNYTFGNVILPAESYVVVCGDSLSLYNNYGVSGYEWNGVLHNGGEDIVLKDARGNTLDSVDYDDSSPWPTNAKGDGPSIVLCDVGSDNNIGSNWTESTSLTGTSVNGNALKGSPGTGDVACGSCPTPDSTFVTILSCDSTLVGSTSTLFSNASKCDSVHTIITMYDAGSTTLLASISICSGDSIFIFAEWQMSGGIFYDTLQTQHGCDSILSQELVVDSIINSSGTEITCFGDSVLIFGNWEMISGVYSDTSSNINGCDSIHTISLLALPISTGSSALEICEGDSLLIGGSYYGMAGVYNDTLIGSNTCDSIVRVTLTVNLLDTVYQSTTTGHPLQAGIFDTTYTNSNGCDSTVITTVTYLPTSLDTLVITEIMYNPPESGADIHEYIEIYNPGLITVDMTGYSLSDAVNYTFGNVSVPSGGYVVVCKDSLALYSQFAANGHQWSGSGVLSNGGELILLKDALGNTIDSVPYSPTGTWPIGADGDGPSVVLCDWTADNTIGSNWIESTSSTGNVINGNMLMGSPGADDVACGPCTTVDSTFINLVTCDSSLQGVVVVTLTNQDGCDSIITTTTILDPGSVTQLADKSICNGDSTLIFGMYQTLAGTYYDSLINKNGCDSTLSRELILNPTYSNFLTPMSICDGDSVLIFGLYQDMAGVYYDTLKTTHGCDSIIGIMLAINLSDTVQRFTTTLDSSLAGIFDTLYTNVEGCDSVVITTVVYAGVPCVNDSIIVNAITCDSTSAGTTIVSYPKVDGCDSIVLTITIYDGGSVMALPDKMICEGDSILVFNTYQYMAGTYYDTLLNSNGCDSLLSCGLLVNPTYETQSNVSICSGDSLLIFGEYQGMAGVYVDTLQSLLGCDSIHTVVLVVKPNVMTNVKDSICPGEGLFVGGAYQTTAGVYYDTLTAFNGCDSIIEITLSVRTDSECDGKVVGDSVTVVTGKSGWMKSTVTNIAEAGSYPWRGVSDLPALATFTMPAELGQPHHYHSIDSVDGAKVFKTGNGITFFRTTFNLTVDTGVSARFRSYMDDGIEIYINGKVVARESDREVANLTGVQHHLIVHQNGDQENGALGEQEFDVVNNYRMDSLVHIGSNELIIALRNAPQITDKGGFSFRMDIKTGEPYMPVFTGFIVSDAEWQQSTVTTIGGSSWSWPGVSSLPSSNTFTQDVKLGQPYSWYSTQEINGSFAIEATENVTYYRRRFTLVDSADINVRLRSTFDENIMIFINDSLLSGHFQHNLMNRSLPAHDAWFPSGGVPVNGNAGGDMFMQVENVNFDQILRKGDNYITVALQNRANDKGGFSLRLDLDKAGASVIRKAGNANNRVIREEVKLELDFDLYPNPTTGHVHISLLEGTSDDNEVVVTDLNGKILLRRALVHREAGAMGLDLGFLPKGIYMVRVRSGEVFKGKPLVRF
ncbi:subtilase family protease [Owenweeksia hongkongensis DSM 17368]|uniref:Subtilase family protease n=1 Tax=Owenweeksia hongkongensis (strain DSM 17368 / CIP 108786 / JCM 12287 / NRRL B-23963 / UST20020801) TaxID=926562 RepID=G8R090_OWEHD|nr:lamin tail domain-containing protein [Owenweeksia hongkongensis]AEV33756.1 subtilase family protease [Owenweeksia hongkongensis DSM 17368]